MQSQDITKKIKTLRKDIESYKTIWLKAAKADEGTCYPVDLLFTSASHRAMCLIEGFCIMLEKENFICAAPLIRLLLDTLLRFYSIWLVDNPHELATKIFKGEELRKIKDRDGNKMLDSYLVGRLTSEYTWIKSVYRETSGYIHLSSKHYFNTVKELHEEDRAATMAIGPYDTSITEEVREEAIDAMFAISEALLRYLYGWAHTKETAAINKSK